MAGNGASAATGDMSVRGGYAMQRISFGHGYGYFLKQRFGAENVDLYGPALSFIYRGGGRIGYGLELDFLKGGFGYVTLNGEARRVDFTLRQYVFKMHLFPPGNWEYGLGLGLNTLTRSLEGFQDAAITAPKLAANMGVAEAETVGAVALGEVLYSFRRARFGLEAGLRYGFSRHYIAEDDPRPALDDAQRPVDSIFDVGGFAWLLTLAILF